VAYTSIATAGWASGGGVQAAYDKLFRWALKSNLVCEPLADVTPEDPTSNGSSVTIFKQAYFANADVVAATTPLNEEADVTAVKLPAPTGVVLTPTEYGMAVVRTEKLDRRGLVPVKPIIAQAVARHAGEVIDYLVQTELRNATNIFRAQNRASTVTITQTDLLRATDIRKSVTTLRANMAAPRDMNGNFVGVFHPDVVHDLREETGSGSWRVPNEYGTDQNKIWNGEFGLFEGVRFIQTPSTLRTTDNDGASSEIVHRSFIMGAEALAKAEFQAPTTVVSPQTDLLKRFFGVGWKADVAYKIFRNESLIALQSASSLT
jgi:N4-gp56 family major capsid protein